MLEEQEEKHNEHIIMPNELPQSSVDNPIPWNIVLHTDDYGATVIAKTGHVVAEFDNRYDAEFIVAAANSFYDLVYRNQRLCNIIQKYKSFLPASEVFF